jgi:hypothetical protein
VSGSWVAECTPGISADDDATCDLIDEDCDGTRDEDAWVSLGHTSFEEAASRSGKYYDTDCVDGSACDPSETPHTLLARSGQKVVMWDGSDGELPWSIFMTPDGVGQSGFVEGDYVGVTSYSRYVGSYTDGSKGLRIPDPDGTAVAIFELGDLASYDNLRVSVDVLLTTTGWESADVLAVWVDNGASSYLLDTEGSDIDGLGLEGVWTSLSGDLVGDDDMTLHVSFTSNMNSEMVFIDNVDVSAACDTPVPECASPSSSDDTTCDGVDDDCDGVADEDVALIAVSCPVNTGVRACVGGEFVNYCDATQAVWTIGFEELESRRGKYYDTVCIDDNGDPCDVLTDTHALVTNSTMKVVSGDAHEGAPAWRLVIEPYDPGFNSQDAENERGFEDGDYVGVTSHTAHVGAFSEGSKGLRIPDPDGTVTLEIELSDLAGLTDPHVSVDFFVGYTSWESDDGLVIWSAWDGGQDVAVDTTGTDLDTYGWEGSWQTVTMNLSDAGDTASLRVSFTSSINEEMIYLDNIRLLAAP